MPCSKRCKKKSSISSRSSSTSGRSSSTSSTSSSTSTSSSSISTCSSSTTSSSSSSQTIYQSVQTLHLVTGGFDIILQTNRLTIYQSVQHQRSLVLHHEAGTVISHHQHAKIFSGSLWTVSF